MIKIQMGQQTRRRIQFPSFLTKLLRILEDAECQQYINWIPTYDGFQIANIHIFTEQVLPKYFKHKNFSSFVRQLNMYGFTKVKNEGQNVYQNPNFKKGSRASLRKIQRKLTVDEKIVSKTRSSKHQHKQKEDESKLEQIKQKSNSLQERMKQALNSGKRILTKNSKLLQQIERKNPHEQQLISSLFKIFAIGSQKRAKQNIKQSNYECKLGRNESSAQESATKYESDYLNLNQFQQFQEFPDF